MVLVNVVGDGGIQKWITVCYCSNVFEPNPNTAYCLYLYSLLQIMFVFIHTDQYTRFGSFFVRVPVQAGIGSLLQSDFVCGMKNSLIRFGFLFVYIQDRTASHFMHFQISAVYLWAYSAEKQNNALHSRKHRSVWIILKTMVPVK